MRKIIGKCVAFTFGAGTVLSGIVSIGAPALFAPEAQAKRHSDEQTESIQELTGSAPAPRVVEPKAQVSSPYLPPAGSEVVRREPLAVYREAGIDLEQERKIRRLAKDFEEQQKVRLKLYANLLKDMRTLELIPAPDEKKVYAKQDELNKLQAEIGTERIKLLLAIRDVLSPEQKQRLVELIQAPHHTGAGTPASSSTSGSSGSSVTVGAPSAAGQGQTAPHPTK